MHGSDDRTTYPTMTASMVRGRANPALLLQVRAVKGAVFARVNVCKAHQRTESCWMKRRLNGEDLHLRSRTSLYQNCAFSLPSSSLNASWWVSSGIVPSLAVRNVAEFRQGWTRRPIQPNLPRLSCRAKVLSTSP